MKSHISREKGSPHSRQKFSPNAGSLPRSHQKFSPYAGGRTPVWLGAKKFADCGASAPSLNISVYQGLKSHISRKIRTAHSPQKFSPIAGSPPRCHQKFSVVVLHSLAWSKKVRRPRGDSPVVDQKVRRLPVGAVVVLYSTLRSSLRELEPRLLSLLNCVSSLVNG